MPEDIKTRTNRETRFRDDGEDAHIVVVHTTDVEAPFIHLNAEVQSIYQEGWPSVQALQEIDGFIADLELARDFIVNKLRQAEGGSE